MRYVTVPEPGVGDSSEGCIFRAKVMLKGKKVSDMELLIVFSRDPPVKFLTFDSDYE